jgi:N-methylhydantoinase A/oxoprolinase/acetone carboxylase beta subunit
MDKLVPGNELIGPAVVESPATTMLVPPGFETNYDNHRIFHLEERDQ